MSDTQPVATPSEMQELESHIKNGFEVRCPLCKKKLEIERQIGQDGKRRFEYHCTKRGCDLPSGEVVVSAWAWLYRTLKGRVATLLLTALGSLTVGGVAAHAAGFIDFGGDDRGGGSTAAKIDFVEHLTNYIASAPNPFVAAELEEVRRRYGMIFTKRHIDYSLGSENPHVMARVADAAMHSIDGISAWSGRGWSNELDPYFVANERAHERGVKVTRVFIIPLVFKHRPAEVDELLTAMTRHVKAGFTVYYAFEHQLKQTEFYKDRPFYSCGLFDNEFFGWDLRTEHFRGGSFPAEIRVSWDPQEIAEKCPFPDIYKSHFLRKQAFEENESPDAIKAALVHLPDPDATQGKKDNK